MTVSRETPLIQLLGKVAEHLQLSEPFLNSQHGFAGLTPSATAIVLLSIFHYYKRQTLVLVTDTILAEKLYSAGFNLLPQSVAFYPELISNDTQIPGFNLENERYRSEAMNFINKKNLGLIFSTSAASEDLAINKDIKMEIAFNLKVGSTIDRNKIIESLSVWVYEQVEQTETPKTFSTRGGILDVFLLYSANPIRIEFFGNTIESIRLFNPRSQLTIKTIKHVEILSPPDTENNRDEKIPLLEYLGNTINTLYVSKDSEDSDFLKISFNNKQNKFINLACRNPKDIGWNFDGDFDFTSTFSDSITDANTYVFSTNSKTTDNLNFEKNKIIPCPIEQSFYSKQLGICCLSMAEINKQKPVLRSRWTVESSAEVPQRDFSSLEDLDWGDYLVHQDFGIGLYRGLEIISSHEGVRQECIKIEYANQANVIVPVDKFNRVHKMILTGDHKPALSILNGPHWKKQMRSARESAKNVVQDLVDLYKSRGRKRGFKYNNNNSISYALEASFPFEETTGQTAAIAAITEDMEQEYPVDRLICGDVGFGKTEVALRAALKAIISGKKVLFLTPTTILADQHYISAKERLEPLGVQIELLSRFKTKKQQKEILEKMLIGSVDLVIGTHRLLSQDVNFPNLGLLIIDEEHRFGVKHKEKLRQLRATVDILTLTATPIPRTLQQSLLGIRDISRISTPPKMRRPIKTFVQYFNWNSIQSIVNNELMRGGQIYYLHNDIASIPFIFKKLSNLFPNHVVGVAHGKMNSKKLEQAILSFFDGGINILLCTTIIESGLDVANANTIIINNAQNFGLSQLYQIRGRVGRSHQQAYCYLLLPRGKTIGASAYKRLKAIEQFTSLGSGYDISLKDLEIRGAGNLFGYTQSGHISAVGFEMYCKLLQEAVDELNEDSSLSRSQPKVSIPINALLDSEYMPLVQDRLHFYQQLSESKTVSNVKNIEKELRDRFGPLPKPAENLLYITSVRAKLTGSSITSISIIASTLKIRLCGFEPFTSVQNLIDIVDEKMTINNFKYQFTQTDKDFSIVIDANKIAQALKALDIFVILFSN